MIAFIMYAQDYDERTVPTSYTIAGVGDQQPLWPANLQSYVKNTQLFVCPSDATCVVSGGYAPIQTYTTGYGIYCAHFGQPLGQYQHPAETVIITDSRGFRTHMPACTLNLSGGTACADGAATWVAARHNEMANFGFMDGHVKTYRPQQLYANAVHFTRN